MILPSFARDKGRGRSFETRTPATAAEVSLNFNEKWNGYRAPAVFALRMLAAIVVVMPLIVLVVMAMPAVGGAEQTQLQFGKLFEIIAHYYQLASAHRVRDIRVISRKKDG